MQKYVAPPAKVPVHLPSRCMVQAERSALRVSDRNAARTRRRQILLVSATVIVDALAPLMQEKASKQVGFSSSDMVLAETGSYFVGGLLLALLVDGASGLEKCVKPARYVAFLPASAAFSTSNFLTYMAVRGLGASQFYLLAQLRVAILAIAHRIRTGVAQPNIAWMALMHLATGMLVLVWYKSNFPDCSTPAVFGPLTSERTASMEDSEKTVWRSEFVLGFVALAGVVISSAFGFLYLEWQLKLHAQDPLFVQFHQLNSFGAAAALGIHVRNALAEIPLAEVPILLTMNATLNGSANVVDVRREAVATTFLAANSGEPSGSNEGASLLQTVMLLSCLISRGVLGGTVLKHMDSLTKGLIDVAAIVLCTFLQLALYPNEADGTVLGIQLMMLLSIISYQYARLTVETPMSIDVQATFSGKHRDETGPKVL